MKVILVDYTQDPENAIGRHAAICYDAKTDRESNIKRARHCKDKGHLATLRFAYATVHIEGISRVCSHQLVRMAHAGILQESQRYVEQTCVNFIVPPILDGFDQDIFEEWLELQGKCAALYGKAVKRGMKKEDARYILPQSCATKVNLCLNFQGWRDFLCNRTGKSAQWEIRAVAIEIERQLAGIAPGIFGEA